MSHPHEEEPKEPLSGEDLLWLMLVADKLASCENNGDMRSVIDEASAVVDNLLEMPLQMLNPSSRSRMLSVFGDRLK
jgi:hypothetical protein